jgi:hypothetical protein
MANQSTLVRKAPIHPRVEKSKPVGKHSEKIAAKSSLTVNELLEDFLRQQLSPNSNDGNSYYVGYVVKVITKEDDNIYLYDIFEDSLVNLERFSNDTNKKETQNTKKILVHIPELFSFGQEIIKPDKNYFDELHYSTAFKVLYTGNEAIEVGNYVKVVFKNNQDFKSPEITTVYKAKEDFTIIQQTKDQIKKSFNDNLNCRTDQLFGSSPNSQNINTIAQQDPTIGYYQLFNNLELVFSRRGEENFARNYLSSYIASNIGSTLSDLKTNIYCSKGVEKTVGKNVICTNRIIANKEVNDYIIYLEVSHPNSDIITKYYDYLQKNLTAVQFTFIKNEFTDEGKKLNIEIDILAFSIREGETPSLETYLNKSEVLKNGGSLVLSGQDIPAPEQSSGTIISKTTPDACENQIPTNLNLYLEPDRRYQKFIDKLLLGKSNTILPYNYGFPINNPEDLILTHALYFSGEKALNKDTKPMYTFSELEKINKNFYSTPERVLKLKKNNSNISLPSINSNFFDSKKNYITEDALNLRLEKLSNFLLKLRENVRLTEQVPISNVLILPINVLRAKKINAKDFEFSRHYFGLAVDFVIFVKFPGNLVKQIPSDVVYLYCRKTAGSDKKTTGNGLYLDENYNHFEYLFDFFGEEDPKNSLKKLSSDEKENGRIWVKKKNLDGDLKEINDQSSQKIEQILINYVMKTKGSVITGQTTNKIMELVR